VTLEQYGRVKGILCCKLFQWVPTKKFGRLILFGESSLSRNTVIASALGKSLGISRATPGLIAMCCIFAIYAVSPDSELRPIGDKSGIPYAQFYRDYKKHLLLGAHKSHVKAVLEWFQSEVFAGVDPSVPIRPGANDGDYNEEFDAMYFATDDEEEPAGREPELTSHMAQLAFGDEPPVPLASAQINATPDGALVQVGDPAPLTVAKASEKSASKEPVLSPVALELPLQGRRTSSRRAAQKSK